MPIESINFWGYNNYMTQNNKKKDANQWLFEGFIVACFSITAYSFSLAYEIGFAHYFGIPFELIVPDFKIAFVIFVSLMLVAFLLFILTSAFLIILPKRVKNISLELSTILVFLLVLGYFHRILYLYLFIAPNEFVFVSLAILIVLGVFIGSGLLQEAFPEISLRNNIRRLDKSSILLFFKGMGHKSLFIALFLIIAIGISYLIGHNTALSNERFLLLSKPSETVVLRIYGNTLVCARFNKITKTIQNSFIIKKVGENASLEMHYENVGPLLTNKIRHKMETIRENVKLFAEEEDDLGMGTFKIPNWLLVTQEAWN
ncbi:hypothetical protein ACFL5U_03425 [Candidatus Margulisiibacteriota bacterium]